MPNVDLDARRAARLAQNPEPKTFTFGGEQFTLPPEPSLEMGELWAAGENLAGLKVLLGADQYERFMGHTPSRLDLDELAGAMLELYGMTQGESPASVSSLPKGGSRSRRTSSASTA